MLTTVFSFIFLLSRFFHRFVILFGSEMKIEVFFNKLQVPNEFTRKLIDRLYQMKKKTELTETYTIETIYLDSLHFPR